MKRKVIQHGPATLIISLPHDWVKKYEIHKGDELQVSQQNNTLLISKDIKMRSKDAHIDISSLDRTTIMYTIRSIYRLGYDTLKLTFSNDEVIYQRTDEKVSVRSVIHTELGRLIGFEIVEETRNSCLIKDLQEASGKDFDTVLRRIFLLLLEAYQTFLEGSKTNNIALLKTIDQKHDAITKLVSYCLRLLNIRSHPNPQKTTYYYHTIAYLDRITDNIKYAARDLVKLNEKIDPKVIEIFEAVGTQLQGYYKLFYTYKPEHISQINTARYEAEKTLQALSPKVGSVQIIVATYCFHIMEFLLDLIEARSAIEY